MIDRQSRDRLAELLRRLVGGRITTAAFANAGDEFAPESPDAGVRDVFAAADSLYSDLRDDRLRGRRRLAPDLRRKMVTAVVFLHTDIQYEWPEHDYPPSGGDCLLLAASAGPISAGLILSVMFPLGIGFPLAAAACFAAGALVYLWSQKLAKRGYDRWVERQHTIGDFDVWPFIRRADFDKARKRPKLLAG